MKFGVVVFPGSNCDHDAFHAIGHVLNKPVEFIWHQSQDLHSCDAIILPGGFSYGDYLRTGAIARFSPVMKSVEQFANKGGLILGIGEVLSVAYLESAYRDAFTFGLMILILIVRPSGLFRTGLHVER